MFRENSVPSVMLVVLVVTAIVTPIASYQVKPANYAKLLEQQEKFDAAFEKEFYIEHTKYVETGVRSERLDEMFEHISQRPDMFRLEMDDHPLPYLTAECTACRALVTTYLTYRRVLGWDRDRIALQAASTCETLNILTPANCLKIVNKNIDILLYIIDNRPALTAQTICGIIFQSGTCVLQDPAFLDWTINVSGGGRPITASKTGPNREAGDMKIIHITDVHYDPHYRTGYNAVCGEPCCCREGQGIPADPANGAGEWGDYRDCDSPWKAVEDAVRAAARQHPDAAYIYYTGDIIDHGVWETTVAGNIVSMTRTYQLFRDTFPGKQVFPVLGNHENNPTNVFAPSYIDRQDFSARWLYDFSADQWSGWLPAATQQTIRQGGFYTALVRPGFRIIGMNNNDAYTFNWWILYDPAYLRAQLQWLHDTLLQAEAAGEKVHILAHIPIGAGTSYRTWARQYRRILDRFWDVITAHFHGHTHADEFNVFYSLSNPQHAISVGFNGGGTVPFSNYNPNYVVYYVNQQNYQVSDFESWYFSLTEANQNPARNPIWMQLYSFNRDFQLSNVSPASLDTLVRRFASNPAELRRYWEFKVKRGDPFIAAGCNGDCLLNHLCQIVTNEANDDSKCNALAAIFRNLDDELFSDVDSDY
ncbi:sphingomyelin phosphodiesterase-like [Anopheles albimanus]|uniref:Sphingomyelin phosphodiesterase n=1 Tax=Anopheles albimanus TaxID=7167 RepID=A0A182FA11_ANOAL|nr:sphingomyelin phosphodiesterase-like [Anopheles albimanus]